MPSTKRRRRRPLRAQILKSPTRAQVAVLNQIQATALDCQASIAGLKELLSFNFEGDLMMSYHPNAYPKPVPGLSRLAGRADAIDRAVTDVLNNLRLLARTIEELPE